MLAATTAALCYAAGAVYSRTLLRGTDAVGLSAIKLALATGLLLPITLAFEGLGDFATLSGRGWLGLLVLGLVSTGLGRCIYQWVIATSGSVRASLVTYIVPVVSLLLGWLVLGETPSLRTRPHAADARTTSSSPRARVPETPA
jgi:drug/metabolite transporter (DMT)-like permease